MPDSVGKRLLFLSKGLETLEKIPHRHSPLMFLDPTNHPAKRAALLEITNADYSRRLVTGDKDSTCLLCVLE